jgi:hypothetical protein
MSALQRVLFHTSDSPSPEIFGSGFHRYVFPKDLVFHGLGVSASTSPDVGLEKQKYANGFNSRMSLRLGEFRLPDIFHYYSRSQET